MAGVSGAPWRLMARRGGAALVYTEMVSAAGLIRRQPQTMRLMRTLAGEEPVAVQLFGGDPEVMGRGAAALAGWPFALVDINMGCPVRKVRRQGAGSALLDDHLRAAEVVAAVVANTSLPVTVKVRLGYSANELDELVPRLAAAGAQAVCLHARTVKQGFAGAADWETIARLKAWCPLPVIGNGDVRSARDAIFMLERTGCDAVMIGRAALGDPWIFGRAADLLAGRAPRQVGLAERRQALMDHAAAAFSLGGEGHAMHLLRISLMWYTKGLPGVGGLRRAAGMAPDLASLQALVDDFFAQQSEAAA